LRYLYLVLSLLIVALGAIHVASTPRFFPHLTTSAVWFAAGGIAIILTGALNLLRRSHGKTAFGLRLACIANNVVMTAFALLAGYVSHASISQFVVVVGVLGGATLCSLLPSASN
jgi:hypothetical protein